MFLSSVTGLSTNSQKPKQTSLPTPLSFPTSQNDNGKYNPTEPLSRTDCIILDGLIQSMIIQLTSRCNTPMILTEKTSTLVLSICKNNVKHAYQHFFKHLKKYLVDNGVKKQHVSAYRKLTPQWLKGSAKLSHNGQIHLLNIPEKPEIPNSDAIRGEKGALIGRAILGTFYEYEKDLQCYFPVSLVQNSIQFSLHSLQPLTAFDASSIDIHDSLQEDNASPDLTPQQSLEFRIPNSIKEMDTAVKKTLTTSGAKHFVFSEMLSEHSVICNPLDPNTHPNKPSTNNSS